MLFADDSGYQCVTMHDPQLLPGRAVGADSSLAFEVGAELINAAIQRT